MKRAHALPAAAEEAAAAAAAVTEAAMAAAAALADGASRVGSPPLLSFDSAPTAFLTKGG